MSRENVETIERFFALYSHREFGVWVAMLAPDIERHVDPQDPDTTVHRGPEAVERYGLPLQTVDVLERVWCVSPQRLEQLNRHSLAGEFLDLEQEPGTVMESILIQDILQPRRTSRAASVLLRPGWPQGWPRSRLGNLS